MSFFDDSPELADDLRDVFHILYPPSPTSTIQDDWEESEEGASEQKSTEPQAITTVDLDGPVNELPPLDIHERQGEGVDPNSISKSKTSGYVETLIGKLSRKRLRAILDSTLPLIGHAADAHEKVSKKRKLIEVLQPGIHVPEQEQYRKSILPAPRFQAQLSAPFGTPAKRNRQRSSERTLPYTSTHPAYAPFSPLSYLAMLRTFSLKTYPTKPSALSPQACAQAGWINEGGQDRLFCRVCQKAWRVELPGDVVGGIRLSPQMKQKYVQLLAEQLVSAHASSCPWRVIPLVTIHQDLLLLNPPISSHLASSALDIEKYVLAKGETPSVAHFEEADFELLSPLKTTEVDCLTKNLNDAVEAENTREDAVGIIHTSASRPEHARKSTAISSTAANMAFFGWNVFRPGSSDPVEEQPVTRTVEVDAVVPDVLRCKICNRKIGLWAFRHTKNSGNGGVLNAKALDVVLEHREFCPIRTLSSKSGHDPEDHGAWWTQAAILHSTPIHPSQDTERIGDQVADSGIPGQPGIETAGDGVSSSSDLGSVVSVLKAFIG